eukprot:PhM_4_TR9839/c0_g1_i1/m.18152
MSSHPRPPSLGVRATRPAPPTRGNAMLGLNSSMGSPTISGGHHNNNNALGADSPHARELKRLQRQQNYQDTIKTATTSLAAIVSGEPSPSSTIGAAPTAYQTLLGTGSYNAPAPTQTRSDAFNDMHDTDEGELPTGPIPATLRRQIDHIRSQIDNKLSMASAVPVKETMRLMFEARTMLDKLLKDIPTYREFREGDEDVSPVFADTGKVTELYNEFRKVPVILPRVGYHYNAQGRVEVGLHESEEFMSQVNSNKQSLSSPGPMSMTPMPMIGGPSPHHSARPSSRDKAKRPVPRFASSSGVSPHSNTLSPGGARTARVMMVPGSASSREGMESVLKAPKSSRRAVSGNERDVHSAMRLAHVYTAWGVASTQTELNQAKDLFDAHETAVELDDAKRTISVLEKKVKMQADEITKLEAGVDVLRARLGKKGSMAKYLREVMYKDRTMLNSNISAPNPKSTTINNMDATARGGGGGGVALSGSTNPSAAGGHFHRNQSNVSSGVPRTTTSTTLGGSVSRNNSNLGGLSSNYFTSNEFTGDGGARTLMDLVLLCFETGDSTQLDEYLYVTNADQAKRVADMQEQIKDTEFNARQQVLEARKEKNYARARMTHTMKVREAQLTEIRDAMDLERLHEVISSAVSNIAATHARLRGYVKEQLAGFQSQISLLQGHFEDLQRRAVSDAHTMHHSQTYAKAMKELFHHSMSAMDGMTRPEFVLSGSRMSDTKIKEQLIMWSQSKIGADGYSLIVPEIDAVVRLMREIRRAVVVSQEQPDLHNPTFGFPLVRLCKQVLAYLQANPEYGDAHSDTIVEVLQKEYLYMRRSARLSFVLKALTHVRQTKHVRSQKMMREMGLATPPAPVFFMLQRIDEAITYMRVSRDVLHQARTENARMGYSVLREVKSRDPSRSGRKSRLLKEPDTLECVSLLQLPLGTVIPEPRGTPPMLVQQIWEHRRSKKSIVKT